MGDNQPQWKNTLRRAAQRANPNAKCSKCGSTKNVQQHHKTYKDSNVTISLCQDCHAALHEKKGTWGQNEQKS
jgi:transcription elongation factor Elf1